MLQRYLQALVGRGGNLIFDARGEKKGREPRIE